MLTYTARLLLDGVVPTLCLPSLAPQALPAYSRAGEAGRHDRAGRRAAPRAVRVAAGAGRARRGGRPRVGAALRVQPGGAGHAAQAAGLRRRAWGLRLLCPVG